MRKRAVLVFADNLGLDRTRRRFPRAAEELLAGHRATLELKGADVHLFTSGVGSGGPRVHSQSGSTFAGRLENASATLTALGYDEIVMIGRDCPELCEEDIHLAFAQLASHRLILGPDHRGGCYLIAFRAADLALLQGIRWNENTDCAQLVARAHKSAVFFLTVKRDLDSWADIRLAGAMGGPIGRLASLLLDLTAFVSRQTATFIHAAIHFVRLHGQMPPPVAEA